jgi:pimeloyl-ACP methyl ester carboxylesterase
MSWLSKARTTLRRVTLTLCLVLSLWVTVDRKPALAAPDRPVVFIPGMVGSKLCVRGTNTVVWGERSSLENFSRLALPAEYDPGTLLHEPCGIIDSIALLGPWRIHQYDDLFETFKSLQFVEKKNLFVFAYDWRLSNKINADNLEKFIAGNIPTGEFDIVAHSMGGIVAKLWLARASSKSRVKRLITLGTPFLGSAAALRTIDSGWGFWANLAANGLDGIRQTMLTFPSVYELLPSYANCCEYVTSAPPSEYFDIFDPQVWRRFRWLPTSLSSDKGMAWLASTLATAKAISLVRIAQDVRLVPIGNSLIETPWRILFNKLDGKPIKYINRGGDGTVYYMSAANGQRDDLRVSLVEHQRLFADQSARSALTIVLEGGQEMTAGSLTNIRSQLTTADGQLVSLTSVHYEIRSPVAHPSEENELVLDLAGEERLARVNLSNLTAYLEGEKTPLALKLNQARVEGGDGIVQLTFSYRTPKDIGPYSVTVRLPNVADLSDLGLVIR